MSEATEFVTAVGAATVPPEPSEEKPHASLRQAIDHATHFLPSQGPIRVFVHHNTLHAFEHEPFSDAVRHATQLFGCNPYLPEERYHAKLARGRILPADISAVLLDDLGDHGSALVGVLGTRFHLRLAMLQHPLQLGSDAELNWLLSETPALWRFRPEIDPGIRIRMVEGTRRWIMRDFRRENGERAVGLRGVVADVLQRFKTAKIEHWTNATWQAVTLHLLWEFCLAGARKIPCSRDVPPRPLRHRDWLLRAFGVDTDRAVHEVLIKFCAAFLDQGVSSWKLPGGERGFWSAFADLYKTSHPVDRWLRPLPSELSRLERDGMSPLEVIDDSLWRLGVAQHDRESYITQTLLALRGWAGMLWQMETNAEWTVHPAPPGTLDEYLAVRLILERLAIAHYAEQCLGEACDPKDLAGRLAKRCPGSAAGLTTEQRAFIVFQLAQTRGWSPEDLSKLKPGEWRVLNEEIESFSSLERRRVYHLAYERRYRNQTLDAILANQARRPAPVEEPELQVITCIDEREESFRRHVEETQPRSETFGVAGFFGVAMYYRGVGDAHFTPLSPVVVKPRHYVREEVVYSFERVHRRRKATRRAIGRTSHWLHTGSRSLVGGALVALAGTLASVPLVLRVLFPRLTAQINRLLGAFVQHPPITRLTLERSERDPGRKNGHLGYSVDEMTAICERLLRDIGLTRRFAPLVVIMGHGSSSLNNPHESAHDCGACGGGRGGPNARAIAGMLNDPRIRERLSARGLTIPARTFFIGGYHNTCNEAVEFFDLDRLPSTHHRHFERARDCLEEARQRNAHERCRRFESAELSISPAAALRHVEGRAEDISQVRPEYGHATNAVCFVGRRSRTRGLFLDRRTFLTSYDPTQDDADATILERIVQAVIPVCAGISLEYLFSYIDPTGYGCGTKLPHNIVSLLGVMDGASSDLRPGLPWQMVEIHEPVRILFVVETTVRAMRSVLERNPKLGELVNNEWIQLAVLDPAADVAHVFHKGEFEPYQPENLQLPVVRSSVDWYRGWRDHLGYALVAAAANEHAPARVLEPQDDED